ncbi:class I SAM-dependent methyltransferase [Phenylobacterium sp. RIFCSPHIGHO2_01_FULL_69_31]|uniref:class I SAM-dependent methyltransferase n=1 Tax=Phenylobacterium sp. RIFCSPHIGHO2_01_FULL_69_31 TaxID=1801944 RepID=UPI000AD9F463|nr:class I SAM-dependent methyltransferase [Phenylobacterium sp. RIFCSPHIGHO2_01_FULL_69_31]
MDAEEKELTKTLALYDQNSQTFRSLNQLMWQIPLIAMTLTGGLWFGVSKAEATPTFQFWLLLLAFAGNVGLAIVLSRLRYIMERYLNWLEATYAEGFVSAPGTHLLNRPLSVRRVFQIMLGLAAVASLILMIAPAKQLGLLPQSKSEASVGFYDRQARDLADSYEGLPFEQAHPALVAKLQGRTRLRVLDVGSGTGRDAAWLAAAGHTVTAVEPSDGMLRLARELHPQALVRWTKGSLPELAAIKAGTVYDVIALSAVWMHLHPQDRSEAFDRLEALRAPGGFIYMTLRNGPSTPERAMFPTTVAELRGLAKPHGLVVDDLGESPDLLGRPGVSWRTVVVREP